MGKGKKKIKQRINTSLICSIGNNLRGIIKCSQKLRSKEVNNYSNQFSHGKGADNTEYSSFFCPFVFFCSQILADKGSQRHSKASNWEECKALYFGIRTAACHCAGFNSRSRIRHGCRRCCFCYCSFSVYQCALMLASTFKKPRRIQNTSVPYSYGLADAPPDYFQWSASRTAKLHYFTGKCSCSVQY